MSKPIKPLTIHPVVGDRIYLRRLLVTDVAEDYLAWLRDDEVVSHLELRFAHHTLESLRHYVIGGMAARDKLLLAFFLRVMIGTSEIYRSIGSTGIIMGPMWGF
ncbi:MAG: hypothetical protein HQK59_05685 [Deltaproteobacteria bacterium]|nr:hypothetical protein [Deltaproteobacteria bacterium]